MKPTRETVESTSDVINIVGVPQIQYIDRAVDIPVVRGLCVFLKLVTSQASKIERRPWL